jgi:hypothetical protein
MRRGTIECAMDVNDLDHRMRLAVGIIQRCLAGEGVELQEKILTRYEPSLHRCHDNVLEFVEKHPELTHVRGFYVANRQPIADTTLVIAHSVVAAPDGSLNNITPSELDVRIRSCSTRARMRSSRSLPRARLTWSRSPTLCCVSF